MCLIKFGKILVIKSSDILSDLSFIFFVLVGVPQVIYALFTSISFLSFLKFFNFISLSLLVPTASSSEFLSPLNEFLISVIVLCSSWISLWFLPVFCITLLLLLLVLYHISSNYYCDNIY